MALACIVYNSNMSVPMQAHWDAMDDEYNLLAIKLLATEIQYAMNGSVSARKRFARVKEYTNSLAAVIVELSLGIDIRTQRRRLRYCIEHTLQIKHEIQAYESYSLERKLRYMISVATASGDNGLQPGQEANPIYRSGYYEGRKQSEGQDS